MSEVVRRLTEDVANIQKLGDNPRTDNGMDAAELKAWFDKAPEAIKAFLNESMIPDIEKKFQSQDERTEAVENAVGNFVQGEGFLPSDGSKPMTGNLNMGGNRITGMAAPADEGDAATKQYVDGVKATAESALSKASAAQPALNFVPVQQGFTANGGNKISLAWKEAGNGRYGIAVKVDDTELGAIIMDNTAFGGTLPIGNGGTGATTRTNALKNLNASAGTPTYAELCFEYLQNTGLATAPVTTLEALKAMSSCSSITFTQHTGQQAYLTDAPLSHGIVTLKKGTGNSFLYAEAMDAASGIGYRYRYNESNNTYRNGWRRILANQLSTDDYGTTFPANAVTGQVYYLKG